MISGLAGDTLDDFVRSLPGVNREQAVAALRRGAEALQQKVRERARPHD